MTNRPKILLVGHDNYGSREIFDRIVTSNPEYQYELAVTTGLYYKRSFLASVIKLLKEASFVFCFRRFIDLLVYRFKGRTLETVARNRQIPVWKTDDINGVRAHSEIDRFDPDLLVSLFTMHIYREPTLNRPRMGSIGSHPSILPQYRGLEVFFWALANGEKSMGVSVFFLKPKVDMGDVFLQERFEIMARDSVEGVYERLTGITARMLSNAVRIVVERQKTDLIPSLGPASYFPMPTREAYRRFRRSPHFWAKRSVEE